MTFISNPVAIDGGTLQLVRNCLIRDAEKSPVRAEILEMLVMNTVGFDDFVETQKPKKDRND